MKEQRTCIACRNKNNKANLLRIVSVENEPILDTTHKINSRGVYICNNIECIQKILKMKNPSKILKIDVDKDKFIKLIENLGEN